MCSLSWSFLRKKESIERCESTGTVQIGGGVGGGLMAGTLSLTKDLLVPVLVTPYIALRKTFPEDENSSCSRAPLHPKMKLVSILSNWIFNSWRCRRRKVGNWMSAQCVESSCTAQHLLIIPLDFSKTSQEFQNCPKSLNCKNLFCGNYLYCPNCLYFPSFRYCPSCVYCPNCVVLYCLELSCII